MIVAEPAAANLGQTEKLNNAKRALKSGMKPMEAFQKYGWFPDENGTMKTVIGNAGEKYTPPKPGSGRVPVTQVLQNERFYKAVPGAKQWTTSVRRLPFGIRGMANPATKHITLTPNDARTPHTMRHELQHAGQAAQKLPANNRGTNPWQAGGMQAYRRQLGEFEARLASTNRPASEKARALIERARVKGVTKPRIAAPPKPPTPKTPTKPQIPTPAGKRTLPGAPGRQPPKPSPKMAPSPRRRVSVTQRPTKRIEKPAAKPTMSAASFDVG